MYSVQCALYSVRHTLYNASLYNVHPLSKPPIYVNKWSYTLKGVQCKMYNIHCTLYNIQCTLYTVYCTLYSVQGALVLNTGHTNGNVESR